MKSDLNIQSMENEELFTKTKKMLIDIICENGVDDMPFKLPNEDELSQRLGVSRNVLRDALMSLKELGIVTRRRSKGTIANPKLARETGRMDSNPEMKSMLEDMGFIVRSETLRLGFEFGGDSAFGEKRETYLNVEKLFIAEPDDMPLAYCSDHISGKYAENAGDSILELKALSHYEFLEKHCNTSMAYSVAHLDATHPEPWLAELMHLSPTDPVLAIDDYVYNYDHEVVVHSHVYYRHGCLDLKVLRKSW